MSQMKAPESGMPKLLYHRMLEGNRTKQEEEGTELFYGDISATLAGASSS